LAEAAPLRLTVPILYLAPLHLPVADTVQLELKPALRLLEGMAVLVVVGWFGKADQTPAAQAVQATPLLHLQPKVLMVGRAALINLMTTT